MAPLYAKSQKMKMTTIAVPLSILKVPKIGMITEGIQVFAVL